MEDKKKTGEDWKCIFAQYVAPYIKSEFYAMQNLYDSWQARFFVLWQSDDKSRNDRGCLPVAS